MRGRDLENAVGAGCKRYEREGRAFVKKNATPMRRYQGEWRFAEKADADFSGPVSGGGFFAGECKEVLRDRFEIFNERAGLKPHQRERLEKAASLGESAISGVIVGFLHRVPWEVYLVPIRALVPFLDAPWRRSVTPEMCRVWGLLLPLGASPAGKPLVRFLDGAEHPNREAAIAAVDADRMANPLELPLEEPTPRKSSVLDRPLDPFDPVNLRKFARKKGIKTGMWGKR